MGYARLYSRAEYGLDAPLVTVEVQTSGGLPSFNIVGLAKAAVRESRDRVRGALLSSHFDFPVSRIVVNLAPADLPKHGGRFDLAIALGILAASGQLGNNLLESFESLAELTLAGRLTGVPGVLPAAARTAAARRALIVSHANTREALAADVSEVYAAATLADVVAHLSRDKPIARAEAGGPPRRMQRENYPDIADVRGQRAAKRAITIAAAGGHNLLMEGPPGTGKSMLAARLPGLLPDMTADEALACASVRSVLGAPFDVAGQYCRPFRAPHHSASAAAIIGGGARPRPGEVSRAHNGVLFLDEVPEFARQTLEMLREPLETGVVHLSRAAMQVSYPARFQLIAAMNPCPCGYAGDTKNECRCSADQVNRYRARVSGPLLDRVDLAVAVHRIDFDTLRAKADGPDSATLSAHVAAARDRALSRQRVSNARMPVGQVQGILLSQSPALPILAEATRKFALSARACHRVIRVARTIADLDEVDDIGGAHIAEALAFRLGGFDG